MSTFLDFDQLDQISEESFQSQKPFPFINPSNLLKPGAWEILQAKLPTLDLFDEKFGKARVAGQDPHDRYSLEYKEGVGVEPEWKTFIDELRSPSYRRNICRLFGVSDVEFRFHWHYAPAGRSVSPHVDQSREFGSHIFYFNSPNWQEQWGGQTLVLDDGGHIGRKSAPRLEDFDGKIQTECIGDRSLLFRGGDRSWHGVEAVTCPEDEMRRVFIVVINTTALYWRVRDWVIRKDIQRF